MDHPGPMGRCVRDVATLLQVISGYDSLDSSSVNYPTEDYLSGLDNSVVGLRVALADDEHFNAADTEILQAVRGAAKVFESLGAQVTPVQFPEGLEAARANVLMVVSDAAAYHRQRLESNPENFGSDVLKRLQSGQSYSSVDYALARHTQLLLKRKFIEFFQDYDILLTPTTPMAAPPIEGPDAVEQARLLTRFTAPFNLTGLPALSLTCGFTSYGLPIGLQIISRPWAEALILRAAFAYEQATDWHTQRPPL
jgi:aspartyl-tRNA(Asn)/glutamyl-tRNA(Gln) amidotransferase subunit A